MIALGRDASSLCAKDGGEKPPNTTACIAPIRLMASIAKRAAGIIGTKKAISACLSMGSERVSTVYDHHIPSSNAFLPQHTGEDLNLAQDLLVCVLLLALAHRAIPIYGNLISITCLNVPIDTIVAIGDFSIWIPSP